MFERLFKKISTAQPKSNLLKSPLEDQRQIQKGITNSPADITAVDVPASQLCILLQADGVDTLLHSGTHEIDLEHFDQAKPLHYVYLREDGLCKDEWSFDYIDHHQVELSLSGTYSIKMSSPQRLSQFCLKLDQFNDERDFSKWISQSIATILKTQRVPAEDIHAENIRFTNYLRDALALALRPKGLGLQSLSLNIIKPEQEDAIQDQPDTSAIEDASEDTETHTPPSPAVEQIIIHQETKPKKQFYYVRNGQQHGPFSRSEIEQKLADGVLNKRDLLWQKGLANWKTISEFPEFQSL